MCASSFLAPFCRLSLSLQIHVLLLYLLHAKFCALVTAHLHKHALFITTPHMFQFKLSFLYYLHIVSPSALFISVLLSVTQTLPPDTNTHMYPELEYS